MNLIITQLIYSLFSFAANDTCEQRTSTITHQCTADRKNITILLSNKGREMTQTGSLGDNSLSLFSQLE